MKNSKLFIPIFITGLVAISCSTNSELDLPHPINSSEEIAGVTFDKLTVTDNILSFSSLEEMKNTIWELLDLNEAELQQWYKNVDPAFISQETIYDAALDELEMCTSIADGIAFKEKYKGVFIFNDDPAYDELYNPYLPSEDLLGYSMVLNHKGEVMIGGTIMNFNIHKSVKETEFFKIAEEAVATRASGPDRIIKTNDVYVRNGAKKFWAKSYRKTGDLTTPEVHIKLSAHKHSILGWNTYKTTYYFTYPSIMGNAWQYCDLQQKIRATSSGTWSTGKVKSGKVYKVGTTKPDYMRPGLYMQCHLGVFVYSSGIGRDAGVSMGIVI